MAVSAEQSAPQTPAIASRAIQGSIGASAAILLINTATGVLLARSLGPTLRGVLAAAVLWPTITAGIGTLGLMEASTYHAARRTGPTGTVVGSGLALAMVQSLVFTAVGAVVILAALFHHPRAMVAGYMYLAFVPINILTLFSAGVLNGLQRYAEFQLVRLLVIIVTVAGLGALALARVLTVHHAVLVYLAANALTLAVAGDLLRRRTGPLRFERQIARALFAYGIRSHSSTVSSQLNERLDQLVISIFLASRALGIYVIAVTMTSATYLIGTSMAWVALPQITPLPAGPARTALARRTIQLALGGSILITVPVFVFARPLIVLFFGSAFGGAANIARILLAAVVCLSTNRVLEAVLRAAGRPLDAGLAELMALGATVPGLAILLPAIGLTGAAVASLIAYATSMTWMCRRVSLILSLPVGRLFVLDRADARWLREALGRGLRGLSLRRSAPR
jgi:O-antigen/teichoic acid export membrane protein